MKIWAKSDNPFKSYEFSKFWFTPLMGSLNWQTYRHKMAANMENSPFALYTKFHIFLFFQKSRQHFVSSVKYIIATSILQAFQKERCWFLIWNMIIDPFLINLYTKWMRSSPCMTSQIMLISYAHANSRMPSIGGNNNIENS